MTTPTPSPEAIAEALRAVVKAARQGDARTECGSCDYGLAMGCTCGPMDTALALLDGIGLDPLAQLLAALEAAEKERDEATAALSGAIDGTNDLLDTLLRAEKARAVRTTANAIREAGRR